MIEYIHFSVPRVSNDTHANMLHHCLEIIEVFFFFRPVLFELFYYFREGIVQIFKTLSQPLV